MLGHVVQCIKFEDTRIPAAAQPIEMKWGEIYRGTLAPTGQHVLVYKLVASLIAKVSPQRVDEYVNSLLSFTFMDASVMGSHNVKVLGVVEHQGDKFVVSADPGRNTLEETLLDGKDRLPRQTLLQAAFCVADALRVFGQLNTPHQGLTLDNIYYDGAKWVLGLPRLFQEPEIYTVDERMLDYKAPEVAENGNGCTTAADVWAFGSLVTHMYYHNKPKSKQPTSFANLGSLLLGVVGDKDHKSSFCQKEPEDPVLAKNPSHTKDAEVPEACILELANLCAQKKAENRPPLSSLFDAPVRLRDPDIFHSAGPGAAQELPGEQVGAPGGLLPGRPAGAEDQELRLVLPRGGRAPPVRGAHGRRDLQADAEPGRPDIRHAADLQK